MSEKKIHKVRFEPVGVEMECEEGEWVLDAAFRQGIAVAHGCREGRCSSCKCVLLEGDAQVQDYSTFALPDYERDAGHVLLCRTYAFSDLTVELLNYDEDLMRRSIAVRDFPGELVAVSELTHDIRLLEVRLAEPMKFWAGQYVELTVPEAGVTRSYSMASTQSSPDTLRFIIRKYPQGAFSSLVDARLRPGTAVSLKGPFGGCFRREARPGPMLLVGGGSGMAPLWSILQDHIESGEQRPIRFFYGARSRQDLFFLEEFAAVAARLTDFEFIPVLSQAAPGDGWTGETGFVHEALQRVMAERPLPGQADAYVCGPPPMVDAVLPALQRLGVAAEHTHVDKFVQAGAALSLAH
ncbi:2Fe-2S iron-sulfur cluster binding domain-containing protein [Xylophilus rhododendri]|uniref:2Fe-2S iron-sulfur cluster binding domain-containing protein n=1 Tax=Xylophilus rhododendri TaxID=2697032 RepID=A0A857J3A3_9BURK|nr:2Fe-2S iron-sulfur cluster binding domain-containing protein [Xylophilus rhododendri]QHI97531.1 2Fe-2S iron-sulfur cluster binding domain-containing protein [Xylophilus rhododendri]